MNDAELRTVLLETLGEIAPEADLDALEGSEDLQAALELDSFDLLTFFSEVSERLGTDIPESDYEQLGSIDRAVDYLQRRRASQPDAH